MFSESLRVVDWRCHICFFAVLQNNRFATKEIRIVFIIILSLRRTRVLLFLLRMRGFLGGVRTFMRRFRWLFWRFMRLSFWAWRFWSLLWRFYICHEDCVFVIILNNGLYRYLKTLYGNFCFRLFRKLILSFLLKLFFKLFLPLLKSDCLLRFWVEL